MTDYRARVILCAEKLIGDYLKGSPQVEAIWQDVCDPEWTDFQIKQYAKTREWCGGSALWVYRDAGLTTQHWVDGIGFAGPLRLKKTPVPKMGDLGIQKRHPFHHVIVERWASPNDWCELAGNTPNYGRHVHTGLDGFDFYSIEPLIRALDTEPAPAPTEPQMPAVPRRTLRWSMNGEDVRELQGLLNQFGHALVCDGNFGRITEAAVKSFQRRAGLEPDGVCGPKTWKALLA